MKEVEVLLSPDFSVMSPNFGDGEIRSIDFSNPNIELRLRDGLDSTFFSIEMLNVEFFHFETTHPQNVIEALYIYPDRAAYAASNPKNTILPLPMSLETHPRTVVVARPITGPEMTCLCKQVRIREI